MLTRAATQPTVAWPAPTTTGTLVDRAPTTDLRFVSYNVLWNTIFEDVSPVQAAKFVRLMRALNPDVLALQEIGLHPEDRGKKGARARTASEVVDVMNAALPPPPGATWHAWQGGDSVIVSKYPLKMTLKDTTPAGDRKQAIALVDLPDDHFHVDLYVFNNHYKCCGGEANDPQRQKQSDAIAAWIRDARTPGGHVDLPPGTPIIVAGDLNIVGGFGPVRTLLEGDIADEATYGLDTPPDWDNTPFTDLRPRHNVVGADDYTWRDDNDRWPPGRLDFIIYSDSVLEPAHSLVLNTVSLSDLDLQAAGLQRFDVTADDAGRTFDHLPLVADFRVSGSVQPK
jgi:endonuclease/exonuclease/phosphatase family metal-dependent hydrolase